VVTPVSIATNAIPDRQHHIYDHRALQQVNRKYDPEITLPSEEDAFQPLRGGGSDTHRATAASRVVHGGRPHPRGLLQGLDFFLAQGGWLSVESDSIRRSELAARPGGDQPLFERKRSQGKAATGLASSVFPAMYGFHKAVGKIQSIAVRIVP